MAEVERFTVSICPECRMQLVGSYAHHLGDCPNLNRAWVPLEFEAVGFGDYQCREQDILALLDALDRMTTDEKTDPCWRDHHGYCQAHWLEEDCSMQHARELLAALRPSIATNQTHSPEDR